MSAPPSQTPPAPDLGKAWLIFRSVVWGITNLTGLLSALLIVVCTAVIMFEVVVRYCFGWATDWEIEACVIGLIIATFLGGAYTLPRNGHIAIDVLDHVMPIRVNRWRHLCCDLIAFAFIDLLTWKSWKFFHEAWEKGWRSESTWAPPLWIPYGFMALGLSLLALHYIVHLVEDRIYPIFGQPPDNVIATTEPYTPPSGAGA